MSTRLRNASLLLTAIAICAMLAGCGSSGSTSANQFQSPQKPALAITTTSLPDGTNHVAHTLLNATGKQIVVNTTNSNYRPVGQ